MAIHGTRVSVRGERHPLSKITTEDVLAIDGLHASGMTHQAIGDRFGLSQGSVTSILHRHRWKHVPRKTEGAVA